MEAAYDPLVADRIYLFPERGSNKYWVCNLADRSREFQGASFWDVWLLRNEQKKTIGQTRVQSKTKKRQHEQFVIDKIAQAEKTAPDTSGLSNAGRIRAINENRREEKARERHEKAHRPATSDNKKSGEVIHLVNPELDLNYPDYIDELFGDDD